MTGGKDPESRKAFPWDPARWDSDLLDATRRTFALRRSEAALRADWVRFLGADGAAVAFERRDGERRLAIALNAGEARASLPLGAVGGEASLLLSTGRARVAPADLATSDGAVSVELPPRAGVVVGLS